MTDAQHRDAEQPGDVFAWHPEYRGKSLTSVRTSLATEIASDQRAYALTLDGAEEHEGDSLTSIIALERKWGSYDLNWAESDPRELADRIIAFERERERRQEMISYPEYRDMMHPVTGDADPTGSQRLDSPVARGIVVVMVALILILVWYFLIR